MSPRFEPWPLRCGRCNHEWTGHVAVNCQVGVAMACLEALVRDGCPACFYAGREAVLLVLKPQAEEAVP